MADQSRDLVQRGNSPGSPPASKGKNFLFAIAINDYTHCSKLKNAVYDVEAFIELMSKRFDFEEKNILFLKDKEANKKQIETEFLRLIKKISPEDNLVLYFSGHGRYDEQYGGNWVPVEAGTSDDDWADYLTNDQIKSYLGRINSKHTFLIADSCFSGSLFMDKSKGKFTGDRPDTVPSRWGLTSGKKEIVSDGDPGQHSPFAQALLDVYSRADQPPSTTMVCAMVIEMVTANAQQTPMGSPLAIDGHKGGQMIFYFKENEDEKQRKAWDLAKAAKTKSALYRFEREYPDSEAVRSHAVDRALEALDEDELWAEAENIGKVSAYRNYLRKSSLRKYEQAATEAIDELLKQEELQAWQKAKQDNTTAAYQKYLRDFPSGEFVKEAQMALANFALQNKPENPLFDLPQLETDVPLAKKVRIIRFVPRDAKQKTVPGAEIRCTNSSSVNKVKLAREEENFEIKFEGEELKDTWMLEAKKGNLIAKDYLIVPKNSDDVVNLTLVPHSAVRFEVTHDSKPLYGYNIQIPGKNIKPGTTQVEFIGEEIDKNWTITISHRDRGFEDKTFNFCPAKGGEFISVSLFKKRAPQPQYGFKVSAGEHGALMEEKNLTTLDATGLDVRNKVLPYKGYKLKNFILQGDTLVAQYSKTNPLFKNTTFRTGGAFVAFILIVFIFLKSISAPGTDQGVNNVEEYIHGIDLKQDKLEELKKTYCESVSNIKGTPKKSLWEVIFSPDSKGEAKSTPTISSRLCPKIQDAINIRLAISTGRLDALQNRVYSDAQKQFEHVVKTIDDRFKGLISDMMFKYKNEVSKMNLNEIAYFIKNYQELLKMREKVKVASNTMELESITPEIDRINFPVDSVKEHIKEEIKMRKSNLRSNQKSLLPVQSMRELQERRWEDEFWNLVQREGPVEYRQFEPLFKNFWWSPENETKRFYDKYLDNETKFKKFQAVPELDRRNARTLDQLKDLIEQE